MVVPLLNELDSISSLRTAMASLKKELGQLGIETTVILNDNNSNDGSSEILRKWSASDEFVRHVRFEKRLTFQQSIVRGFREAEGDCAVVFQGDLQDPWQVVVEFAKSWVSGNKLIVGIAKNRHSSIPQTLFRRTFYSFLKSGSSREMPVGFQDFYLLDRTIYKDLAARPNNFQFIRGTLAKEFLVDDMIPYERTYRAHGRSKFLLGDKYELALDALLVHNQSFTRALSASGLLIAAVSTLFLLVSGFLWLIGVDFGVPGWLSTVSLLAVILGFVTFVSAIQFEYLRRLLVLLMERKE